MKKIIFSIKFTAATFQEATGQTDAAVKNYEELLVFTDVDRKKVLTNALSSIRGSRALKQFLLGNYEKSLCLFREIEKHGDLNLFYKILTGIALQKLQKDEEAENEFNEAIERFSEKYDPYVATANFHFVRGDVERALELYHTALEKEPDNPYIYINMGDAFLDAGEIDEAYRYYQKAAEAEFQTAAALLRLARFYLYVRPDAQKVRELIQRTRRIKPDHPDLDFYSEQSDRLSKNLTPYSLEDYKADKNVELSDKNFLLLRERILYELQRQPPAKS